MSDFQLGIFTSTFISTIVSECVCFVARVASLETDVFDETDVYDALMLVKVNITCVSFSFSACKFFCLSMFFCYGLLVVVQSCNYMFACLRDWAVMLGKASGGSSAI